MIVKQISRSHLRWNPPPRPHNETSSRYSLLMLRPWQRGWFLQFYLSMLWHCWGLNQQLLTLKADDVPLSYQGDMLKAYRLYQKLRNILESLYINYFLNSFICIFVTVTCALLKFPCNTNILRNSGWSMRTAWYKTWFTIVGLNIYTNITGN